MSQAVSLRRVDVNGGNLTLMDYCTGPSFASGGFIADSRAPATIVNGSQQQWYHPQQRGRRVDQRSVEPGLLGRRWAPLTTPPTPTRRTRPSSTTPLSREKPYLYVDDNGTWQVRVPSADTQHPRRHLGRAA